MRFELLVVFFALLLGLCHALFKDQVGKFDWSAKHIGCYHDTFFDSAESGEGIFVTASEKNVIASINTNTGDLAWRQVNEENPVHNPSIIVKDSRIISLLNNGEYVRVFDVDFGVLKWQHYLNITSASKVRFAYANKVVAVLTDRKVYGLIGTDKVLNKWTADIDTDSIWLDIVALNDGSFVIVGALKNGKEIRALKLNAKNGNIEKMGRLPVLDGSLSINLCVLNSKFLLCPSGSSVFSVDISALSNDLKRVESAFGGPVLELKALSHDFFSYFIIQTSGNTIVGQVNDDGKVIQKLTLDRSKIFTLSRNLQTVTSSSSYDGDEERGSEEDHTMLFAAYYEAQRLLKVYSLESNKLLFDLRIAPITHSPSVSGSSGSTTSSRDAPVKSVHFIGSTSTGIYQILTTRRDCRVDFYEAAKQINDVSDSPAAETIDATLEWVRFEALASISKVEMIDLPLSEAQARIETEFDAANEPVWKSFFIRISSQLEQLQRSFIVFSNRFTQSMEMLTSQRVSSSTVLRHLFGYEVRRPRRQRTATVSIKEDNTNGGNFERDYFNLRKLIVVTTLQGSVYALSNDDGEVIWSLYLGGDVTPFHDQLGRPKIPLFIQRGTTFHQYASQAAVVFNSNRSKKSSVIVFNPVTGAVVSTLQLDGLKRVELLPFPNSEMLYPLLLVTDKMSIQFHPPLADDYRPRYPVHLMFVEKSGELSGAQLDFKTKRLVKNWSSRLGFASADETVVSISGKPINQKLHSQGKVLGDRSVLYKYANPNLIAVASVDRALGVLRIWMVDGVNGQIVYSARHPRSSTPIRIVHCENWLVYTYWNENARRTEFGIIELYEGLQPTNERHFNAYTTLKQPLNVFAQSYVFSQGISAIAASETEQGLTTRSLIIAMPFGGVLEISRRFIDARRPLEMTPELREEMMIPYMPELPVATEDLINYNQTVYNVHGIKTAPSGLESTSLVFLYGLDLFYTRVTPSGTFDILKDDFDYVLIGLVMVVLVAASVLCKRIWRYNSLKQAWS